MTAHVPARDGTRRAPVHAAAVEARDWGLRHAGRREWALRGVSFTLHLGERALLLAPSGAGKSTLLMALAGLVDPRSGVETEGTLLVDGRDPRDARDRTGVVFQDPESQIVMGRAGDDVAFGLENRCVPTGEIWPAVDSALAAVDFPYEPAHPTHALSGGERQRLALAGTLALRPGLLLLDEPTASLDPGGAADVRDVLARVLAESGATMLLVEHRVEEALPLVERVLVLEAGGGVVADGPPALVFGPHGQSLASAGVWVPGHPPAEPRRSIADAGSRLAVAEAVTFRYPGATTDALSGIDLAIRESEAVAVLGPNGSGKSTLAMLMAGLLRPRGGRVVAGGGFGPGVTGERLADWGARDLVRRVGTVFQDPEHQFLTGSVREELLLGPRRAGQREAGAQRRVDELLERLGLARLAGANPFTLSGGEKRRLSVATALATAPVMLVLDEPTFGQDRRTWAQLVELLAAMRDEGRGIAFVTHDLPFAAALADRTATLERPAA